MDDLERIRRPRCQHELGLMLSPEPCNVARQLVLAAVVLFLEEAEPWRAEGAMWN